MASSVLRKLAGVVSVVVLVFACRATNAQTFSDSFTVYDATGAVVSQTIATEEGEIANGPDFIYTVPGVAVDQTQFGNYTVLTEPGIPLPLYSDVFGVAANADGSFSLGFSSDVDPPVQFGPPPANIVLPEGNGVFDATMYLDPGLQANGFTAQFISDAEVPEPGRIMALSGMGALGLVGFGWRRRRCTA